jgi:hypothetical protein
VILRREEGEREEIELVSPEKKESPTGPSTGESPGGASDLPVPLCPNGSPGGDLLPEESPPPGSSPLDADWGIPDEPRGDEAEEKGGEA